jgi:hypothetical protein
VILAVLPGRVDAIRGLKADVEAMEPLEPPEEQEKLESWLGSLDAWAQATDDALAEFQTAQYGDDLILDLSLSRMQTTADGAATAADEAGLVTCAESGSWEIYGDE